MNSPKGEFLTSVLYGKAAERSEGVLKFGT
jgi:hypothetical protein